MNSGDSLTGEFKKILLICFGGIGDVILFFPVIKTLKDLYPKAEIIFTVEPRCKNVAEKNPYVKKVITFDLKNDPKLNDYLSFLTTLRKENLDLAISIGRSPLVPVLLFLSRARHRVGYAPNRLKFLYSKSVPLNQEQYAGKMYFDLLKGVGIDTDMLSPIPEINVPQEETVWADNWFKENNLTAEQKVIMIHPGASTISKQKHIIKTWETTKWVELIKLLSEKNVKIILAGGPDDKEDVDFIVNHVEKKENFINAYGQTKNLEQLAALIKKVSLLVCVDSAPLNLAVAVKTPLVAIFGPTNEKKILPNDEKFTAVRIHLDCTPCLWAKRSTTCQDLTCIKDLKVYSVFNEVSKKLQLQ